jgi:hypothetical protein
VRDGEFLGLVALRAAVSDYLECDCTGRMLVVREVTAADSKDQRPGAELGSQRRNLQVCMSDLEWGGVQVQGYAVGSKTPQSRAAWS